MQSDVIKRVTTSEIDNDNVLNKATYFKKITSTLNSESLLRVCVLDLTPFLSLHSTVRDTRWALRPFVKILTFRPRKSILETMKMLEAPSLAAFGQGSFFILSATDSMGLMGSTEPINFKKIVLQPIEVLWFWSSGFWY